MGIKIRNSKGQFSTILKQTCPFCRGIKIKPFMGPGKSQTCADCDDEGMITHTKLKKMGLSDIIERNKKCI